MPDPPASDALPALTDLPAWSQSAAEAPAVEVRPGSPAPITRDWAFGGSTGAGVGVCVVDSGIDADHPMVGSVARAVKVEVKSKGAEPLIEEDDAGDTCGHGTACAGIIRSIAPDCEISSVKVLGAGYKGSGRLLLAGIRWALEQDFGVINLSLSTSKSEFAGLLRELTDTAYFRSRVLVASAHNLSVDSYPWRFSSVISVGSHDGSDPLVYYYNPRPPVEFFARGVALDVAWTDGGTIRSTGNSFATPHMSGVSALILGKHPELTPFQLKSVLHATAANVVAREEDE
jgi:subtilisin family serine protease